MKTKNKDVRTLEERADDLAKILTFSITTNVKKHYVTVENLKKTFNAITAGKAPAAEQVKFCGLFSIPHRIIRSAAGKIDGRDVPLKALLPLLPVWLHYRPHFNKNYRSGRTYSVNSYWYIDFDVLADFVDDAEITDAGSGYYTKLQRKLIYRAMLRKKGETMTRKEKEQYVKEYNEGKHFLSLEDYERDEAKKKRSADKHRMTIAKKAARETLSEYARLQSENAIMKTMLEEKDELIEKTEAENAALKAKIAELERKAKNDVDEDDVKETPPQKDDFGIWMTPAQYNAWCAGEADEDDVEMWWMAYNCTDEEAEEWKNEIAEHEKEIELLEYELAGEAE